MRAQQACKARTFRIHGLRVLVANIADCLWRREQAHFRSTRATHQRGEKGGVHGHVAHQFARRATAEAGHLMLHVGEETLTAHFAVVDEVHARFDLLCDDVLCRRFDFGFELLQIDRFATKSRAVHCAQRRGARQAAGVGGEDALGIHKVGCLERFLNRHT